MSGLIVLCFAVEALQEDVQDMIAVADEVQDSFARTYGAPEVDDSELTAGKESY